MSLTWRAREAAGEASFEVDCRLTRTVVRARVMFGPEQVFRARMFDLTPRSPVRRTPRAGLPVASQTPICQVGRIAVRRVRPAGAGEDALRTRTPMSYPTRRIGSWLYPSIRTTHSAATCGWLRSRRPRPASGSPPHRCSHPMPATDLERSSRPGRCSFPSKAVVARHRSVDNVYTDVGVQRWCWGC